MVTRDIGRKIMQKLETQKQKYFKRYYQQHKEKILQASRNRYLRLKDEINARHRAYGKTEQGRKIKMASKFKCSYKEAEYWLNINYCQICGDDFAIATDHDHNTGKIRGRLCYRCNRAIGAFKDSADLLEKAVKYLRNPSCWELKNET